MTYDVQVGARVLQVAVQRAGDDGRLRVTLDGQAYQVDARRLGAAGVSMLVTSEGNGAAPVSVDAAIVSQREAGSVDVHVGGRVVPLQIRQAGAFGRRRDGTAGGQGSGPERITAPMPGKIARVLVKPGDAVVPKQGLVVVEAMKMENELRASRAGQVREVAVAEGQSVEAGAVLVVVD